MTKCIDLTGTRFHRLTVIRRAENSAAGQSRWECVCDCGAVATALAVNLKSGRMKSCGCFSRQMVSERRFIHGKSHSPEHRAWCNMHWRCNEPSNKMYHRYGARGIKVCSRWKTFANFYSDMGDRPSKDHSIERVDNNGDYTPGNCVWATRLVQNRNQSRNRRVTYRGEIMTVSAALELSGSTISTRTVHDRVARGMSFEDAIKERNNNF